MNNLNDYIVEYIEYCQYRKRLDAKTLKAYHIDLKQYSIFSCELPLCLSKDNLDQYITGLHKQYKPKTIKRKIASLKAFFHYLEYRELLTENPFLQIRTIIIFLMGLRPLKNIYWRNMISKILLNS